MLASENIYGVWETMVVLGGIVTLAAIIGGIIIAYAREEHGRPVFPFGARMRVERAKAHTEVLQQQLEQEAVEVKRVATNHLRTRVLKAIQEDDHETVEQLGLPKPPERGY